MKNLEIEYKVMINEKDFEYLKTKLSLNLIIQENVYYDTKDELIRKNNLALRIRNVISEDMYISTLKIKQPIGLLELEYKSHGYDEFPKEIIQELTKYNINYQDLIEYARLKTWRYEMYIDGCLLCLDKSEAYGVIDYEIECEAKSMEKAREIVDKITNENNIIYTKSTLSKLARAKKYKK